MSVATIAMGTTRARPGSRCVYRGRVDCGAGVRVSITVSSVAGPVSFAGGVDMVPTVAEPTLGPVPTSSRDIYRIFLWQMGCAM